MALVRGKFGIEYNPRQKENEPSALRWFFVLVAIIAVASFVWTLIGRFREENDPRAEDAAQNSDRVERNIEFAKTNGQLEVTNMVVATTKMEQDKIVVPSQSLMTKRPAKVRNLLMRLEEAEKNGDVEMAVTTIETIRSLPASPAADLDDSLARRLGSLNVRRLFELRNAQWVSQVVVKRGDSASRIAAEHGSTMASLARLNGGNVDKVMIGRKIYVMEHPRFNLVVHRRSRTVDLSLNGKFFKRYDLTSPVKATEGAYEIPLRVRNFWVEKGLSFKIDDRYELETLLTVGTPVLISEM